MSRSWILLSFVMTACAAVCAASDTTDLDSLAAAAETVWVIPAGPVAGSFTPHARVSVADTIAGWARIQIEAWVPVGKVMDRMSAPPNPFQIQAAVDPPSKQAAEVRQCEASTRKGDRCTRNARKGSRFCWQHQQR